MDTHRRPHLLSISTPAYPVSTSPTTHTPSQSPFRYVHFPEITTEKASRGDDIALQRTLSTSRYPSPPQRSHPSAPSSPAHHNSRLPYSRPRGLRIANLLRPWIPLIIYAVSSLLLVVAIAFFKTQVFTFLDDLSVWLRADEHFGYAVLFVLIFITTFPPLPMYSTLIILSGYTFGPWAGAVLSYFAALSGALTVFLISRTLLHDCISRWLESACTIKRVVRAVDKRPKLLFLVRLAPYPFNVMNCLLAASPTLTLRTYTVCTAASLFKVIVHTSLGASIHSFKNYNTAVPEGDDPEEAGSADAVARMWTFAGVGLCIAIFVYISWVARRAVDSELDDGADPEETVGFLSSNADLETGARPMVELRR
ncbi:hypothetical protein DFH08DRAFT_761692 [Mycena albidolilacea]|uniref:Golgi apparatus membrane protein TVP38 n=1 Tax=Mycena albidolilacea TaxID=1033008 RepID=A0AAD7AUC5_9AGAR|nr:hypothetical protein DFH08DRAFT_761692 [Mycena albidolilacea]